MTLVYVLAFLSGLGVLYAGAEGTLNGAVRLARSFGISPLVIGLTLVAYGTSAPELSLDITAALRGTTELAFGDLVGSNIANVGLILGAAALVRPLQVNMRLLRAEVPIVISVSLLLWGLAGDGQLTRQDGLILLACFVLLSGYTVRSVRNEPRDVKVALEEQVPSSPSRWRDGTLVAGGLVGLVIGAQLMVYGAVGIARNWGVSEMLIGVTIVAIGTSLPELATALVAARRGEADIVVGNVIGSNIFNLLAVMAAVAVIQPIDVPSRALVVELPIMAAFVIVLVPIMLRGRVISRGEGVFLLSGFTAFIGWQVIAALREMRL